MAIKLNGTDITSNKLNGTSVTTEKVNGTQVYGAAPSMVWVKVASSRVEGTYSVTSIQRSIGKPCTTLLEYRVAKTAIVGPDGPEYTAIMCKIV